MRNRTYRIIAATVALPAIAAIGALLLAEALRERPVGADESAALERQAEMNVRAMQDTLAERVRDQTGSEERRRLDSPRGQALLRRCADWAALVERAPTEDNRAGRDRACGAYRQYVLSGELR